MNNSYDEIKGMLKTLRSLKSASSKSKINEQTMPEADSWEPFDKEGETRSMMKSIQDFSKTYKPSSSKSSKESDIIVINNVDVSIRSDDEFSLKISDEEKGKISQLIDDFRTDVSEIVEFDELIIYNNSAKLTGKLNEPSISFVFSTGDDVGVYLNNASMLKLETEIIEKFKKLLVFQDKFANVINDLLITRD